MAYVKNTWVDQDVERPKTYEVTNNQDGSITLTDSFGLVTELGTPVNETNMNHIEDGIDGCAIRKHNLTETFDLGEWVKGGSGDDEGLYKSLVANNVGNAITDTTKWEKISMGASRNIGEIVQSTIPLTDAGLHLLDGSLLTYGSYQAFIDYIADLYDSGNYDDIFDTEANWQSSVTTYGVCGKFVYDSNDNTVRLPKITGFTQGTIDPTVLGDLVQAGLPNITGIFRTYTYGVSADGAFYGSIDNPKQLNAGTADLHNYVAYGLDASRSSSIYGNSSTVQPQAIKVLYYVVIATSTKTDIQVDIDEIATDLNGKADVDLTNVNNSGASRCAGWAMPSDTFTTLTVPASNGSITATANGWVSFAGTSTSASHSFVQLGRYANGMYTRASSYSSATRDMCYMPVKKGDVVTIVYTNMSDMNLYFIYAEGSKSEAS